MFALIRKKINWKSFWTYWYILIFFSVIAWAANQDFDLDTDTKIDDTFLDLAHDINGIVICDGAGNCVATSNVNMRWGWKLRGDIKCV
jgi:hypothetical protein